MRCAKKGLCKATVGMKYCHNGGIALAPHHGGGFRDRPTSGVRPEGP